MRPGWACEAPCPGCLYGERFWDLPRGLSLSCVPRLGEKAWEGLEIKDHDFGSQWNWTRHAENKLEKQWEYSNLDRHCRDGTQMELMPTS